jgi:hypothetical protein
MGLWNLCTLDPSNNEAQCFGVDIGCTFDQGKVQLANCDLLLATRGLSLLTASLVLLTALCVLLELCTDVVHVFYSTIVRACLSFAGALAFASRAASLPCPATHTFARAAPSAMGAVITGALFRKRSEEVQHDSTWSFGISYYSWATAVALCFCCLVIALATKPPPTTAAQRSSARSSYLAVQ